MDKDILIGTALIAATLGFMIALVLWSRRRIERICRKNLRTARDIERGLQGD
jgi:hypothetical protein